MKENSTDKMQVKEALTRFKKAYNAIIVGALSDEDLQEYLAICDKGNWEATVELRIRRNQYDSRRNCKDHA